MLALLLISDWLPWAAGGILVFSIWIAISAARARKRSQAFSASALEMGFAFEWGTWSDPQKAPHLNTTLFTKGSAKTFRNVMTGSSTGLHVSLFDYSYVVSDGRNSRTCAQTVASFSKTGVQLPEFQMGPKGLLQKFDDALFHTNINFDSHADFSRRYQVRSPTQEKTRELFTGSLLSFFESLDPRQEWRLEGLEETLIVYRAGKRVKPENLRVFLDETARLTIHSSALAIAKGLRPKKRKELTESARK
jgi:hypothetical protein